MAGDPVMCSKCGKFYPGCDHWFQYAPFGLYEPSGWRKVMPEPNEAIGGIVDELISKAKAEIELGKEGSDAKYWEGAEEALLRMEEDKDDLLKYGWNKFRDLLDGLAASGNRAEAARFISTMTADQLITDMGNAADDLAEFARQQAALRVKIGELLADLGKIGAKILLSLL